ncbi:MAG: glycerophosphodiester phosphodiesterase [Bacteroidales bacterium]|nr:glycerophosphodiester phosphodiesterase [Bacteroidales bacterium]
MTKLLIQISVLFFLFLASCVPEQDFLPQNPYIIEEGGRPWVIAHGGAKQLWPENTMPAFEGSVQMGVDVLEIDMKITKDEVLVCHHDHTIDRMSDGEGELGAYTYEELLAFNFGEGFEALDGSFPYQDDTIRIPKLEEVFDRYTDMYFTVEIKDRGESGQRAGELLKALVETWQLEDRMIVAAFDDETLTAFQGLEGNNIPVSTSQKEATKFVITAKTLTGVFYAPEAVALQLPMEQSGLNLSRKHVINSAHKHNMAVHYWTINDKEDMRLLIENGADGLMTDRPDIMLELLEEMGY